MHLSIMVQERDLQSEARLAGWSAGQTRMTLVMVVISFLA
jgi:hypothetical protein